MFITIVIVVLMHVAAVASDVWISFIEHFVSYLSRQIIYRGRRKVTIIMIVYEQFFNVGRVLFMSAQEFRQFPP